jgi:hypothetical protein
LNERGIATARGGERAYAFRDPNCSKSDYPTGTADQESKPDLLATLDRFKEEFEGGNRKSRASAAAPVIAEAQAAGAKALRQIAAALNGRGIATARGGRWEAATVRNILRRAA